MMPPKHDGATVTAALLAFRGNLSAAARSLGHDPKTLWRRVQRNPALWPEGVPRLPQGGLQQVSDEDIRAALMASDGNQTKAARIVGMSHQRVSARAMNIRRDSR